MTTEHINTGRERVKAGNKKAKRRYQQRLERDLVMNGIEAFQKYHRLQKQERLHRDVI